MAKKIETTSKDARRMYADLSWLWRMVSPPEDYVEETELFVRTLKEHAQIPLETVLHLGCGAGGNDLTLKKYFRVTGVDLSPSMLAQAKGLNPEAAYLTGDMRSVRLEERFDAVVILDSIDYNRTEDDIRATFETAYFHLKPGGLLLTVIEYDADNFPQNTTHVETKTDGDLEVTFIENNYDPDPTDTHFEGTFIFMVRRNGELEIHTDQHLVGLFKTEVWLKTMRETGFEVQQLAFTHSSFEAGQSMPMLLGHTACAVVC